MSSIDTEINNEDIDFYEEKINLVKSFLKKNTKGYKKFNSISYKFTSGNKEDNFKTYLEFIYEFYPLIKTKNLNKSEKKLEIFKNNLELLKNVDNELLFFESYIFEEERKKMEEYDDYLVCPFEVVSGVVICGKCGSDKTWSVQKQTRSPDEPMTTFSKCSICSNTWAFSG